MGGGKGSSCQYCRCDWPPVNKGEAYLIVATLPTMSSHDFALPSAELTSNVLGFDFAATEPDFQNEASGP